MQPFWNNGLLEPGQIKRKPRSNAIPFPSHLARSQGRGTNGGLALAGRPAPPSAVCIFTWQPWLRHEDSQPAGPCPFLGSSAGTEKPLLSGSWARGGKRRAPEGAAGKHPVCELEGACLADSLRGGRDQNSQNGGALA